MMTDQITSRGQRLKCGGLVFLSLGISFLVVCALASWIYLPNPQKYLGPEMPADVRAQLQYFYWVWDNPIRHHKAQEEMRRQNPEWDLISRSFFAYSLANVALQYPAEREEAIRHLDLVIDDTLKVPWGEFLLPYGHKRPFVHQPAGSIMVDGEVSLMIGLRRLVRDEPGFPYRAQQAEMIKRCVAAIEDGPVMCGESYPDECWLWCNPLALASIKVFDAEEKTDHTDLFRRWEATARLHLIEPKTGLFYAAIHLSGAMIYPPRGSTIWIGAAMLEPVLPQLALEQYEQMKRQLTGRLICFQFGREFPKGQTGPWDIDSGFTPFGMGPASTGFALVASKEMNDLDFFRRVLGLLDLVGVPHTEAGRMHYRSSNLVGDATFLFGKTTGPAWQELKQREEKTPL